MRELVLTVLLIASAASVAGCRKNTAAPTMPDGVVVLTFDDVVRNHLTFVVPLLEEYGFGATFFVTEAWMKDPAVFLTWPEVAEIHRRGFEVGNHTSRHIDLSDEGCVWMLEKDTERMEGLFEKHGIPKPVSFAWPGSKFGPEAREFLAGRGYAFARRGQTPEHEYDAEVTPLYDPSRHHSLLVPSVVARATYSARRLADAARQARDHRAVVFMFHGVPDPQNQIMSVEPGVFREFLRLLREGGYQVVAMRDLARWVDAEHRPPDPMLDARWPPAQRD